MPKILVVSDDSLSKEAVILRMGGSKIITAEDVPSALEALRTDQDITVVISNLGLGQDSGLNLLDQMRHPSPESGQPIFNQHFILNSPAVPESGMVLEDKELYRRLQEGNKFTACFCGYPNLLREASKAVQMPPAGSSGSWATFWRPAKPTEGRM